MPTFSAISACIPPFFFFRRPAPAALREEEDRLTQAILDLAGRYGRYGYRRITALLQRLAGK